MQYITFTPDVQSSYEIAILVPQLSHSDMVREYLDAGLLPHEKVIGYALYQQGKKTPATVQRDYLDELIPMLLDMGVRYLLVGESEYFKTLTGSKKAEANLGYALPLAFPEGHADKMRVFYVPNFRQVFHNPEPTRAKIKQGLDAYWDYTRGHYRDPGCDIIRFAEYPTEVADIERWLDKLVEMDLPLAADIEAFSLKHHDAGIGTISFAWTQHDGIAFPVDLGPNPPAVRALLGRFFLRFQNKLRWHNISYDVYVLIYQLFMQHICDTEGLLRGLDVMLKNWDDTKLISYLATNSCAGNDLGLKAQSQEFSGNYAVEEIKDIRLIPMDQLLRYNLIDTLSTNYVFDKNYPKMVADDQLEIYETLFKPAITDIIQMQLTGLPLDMDKVAIVKRDLEIIHGAALREIQNHKLVRTLTGMLNEEAENERYADWLERKEQGVKVRAYVMGNHNIEFNPNSNPQIQRLLYELAGLPVIEKTKSGAPGTGKDVLEKLKAHTEDPKILSMLNAFLEYAAVDKILTSFIPAMEAAVQGPDGCFYLFGNFNLGGTVSGRLSSSNPNLQNLPANVGMMLTEEMLQRLSYICKRSAKKGYLSLGKLIKECVCAPPGWLFTGLDFASLEDRISALTTKDPNKLKVYVDGFDGHSLRAHSYFSEQMPDIQVAPENARCFHLTAVGQDYWFHSEEAVNYLGQVMTGAQLWERLQNLQTIN